MSSLLGSFRATFISVAVGQKKPGIYNFAPTSLTGN